MIAERTRQAGAASFHAFIDEAILEIAKRDAGYLSRFPLVVPEPGRFAESEGRSGQCGGLAAGTIERIVRDGIRYLNANYRTVQAEDGGFLAEWVGAMLVDAHQAACHAISLEIVPEREGAVDDVLRTEYDFRAAGSARYYIRKRGTQPMVVINATGLPIDTWRRLLLDPAHNYKLVIPCRPHGDLFAGGIRHHVSLEQEAEEIAAIAQNEAMACVHVLGWCNGARLAIEVAARPASRAGSLILLAPMFKGMPEIPPLLTPYLRDLQVILELVRRNPAAADGFCRKLAELAKPVDWAKAAPGNTKQLEEVFQLPNRRHVRQLLTPLLSADSLVNLVRRVAGDEGHATLPKLSALRIPMMVILGSHDSIVSNEAALEALRKAGCESANLMLLGAGHDLHDLQYAYLRYLLAHFLDRRPLPIPSARVRAFA